jgi:hypothetical protein
VTGGELALSARCVIKRPLDIGPSWCRSCCFPLSTVPVLLGLGGPATICWVVVPVAFYAVDGVLRAGTWPHIGEKSFKAISPPLADRNATRPVILETDVLRIGAARLHRVPACIFGRPLFKSCVTVPFVLRAGNSRPFVAQAPARFRLAALETEGFGACMPSAVTKAIPCHRVSATTGAGGDNKSPEPLPN